MLKKFFACLLALTVALACLSFCASAEGNTLKITVGEPQNIEGGMFEVPISITENPGVISLRLQIEFDSSKLALMDIEDSGRFGDDYHSEDVTADKCYLYWSNPTEKNNITFKGTVAVLTFANVSSVSGDAEINLICNKENHDSLNFDLKTVNTEVTPLKVSLSGDKDNSSEEETSRDFIAKYECEIDNSDNNQDSDNNKEESKNESGRNVTILVITLLVVAVLICVIVLRKHRKIK